MARGAAGARRRERRRWRPINWVAVSATATLMSAIAAMTTAATGVWHPPVPVPVIQAKITWIGPTTPPPAQASPAAAPPTSTPVPAIQQPVSTAPLAGISTPSPAVEGQVTPGVTLRIAAVTPNCCSQAFQISVTATNSTNDPFILAYDSDTVVVRDSTGHIYPVAHSGNRQVTVRENSREQQAIYVSALQAILPSATALEVVFPTMSGAANVRVTWILNARP